VPRDDDDNFRKIFDSLARLETRTGNIENQVGDIKRDMNEHYVRKEEFRPIQVMVNGVIWLLVSGFVLAVAAMVYKRV